MSGVIKVTDRGRGVHAAAFNFDDLTRQADAYLGEVRTQAAQILAKAAQDAAGLRQKAEAEGRKSAEAALEKTAEAKVAQQMQTVLPALREAIAQVAQSRQAWIAQWQQQAIELSVKIAERVIRRELQVQPNIPTSLVREALELASGAGRVRIALNPADHAALSGQMQSLLTEVGRLGEAEVLADPHITAGGCRVETLHGAIDQQIDVQLERIRQELI